MSGRASVRPPNASRAAVPNPVSRARIRGKAMRRFTGLMLVGVACLVAGGCASTIAGGSASPARRSAAERGEGGVTVQPQRQLIRRGQMSADVADLGEARRRVEGAASALGAQVEHVHIRETSRAEYVLRVPPDRLETLMDSVAAVGEVSSRAVSADDVTDHILDAEARLDALRATRDRLRQLLERASTVQDVISVERELARVQGDLESLDARLQAMKGQVAMSKLDVHLRRPPVLGPLGVLLNGVWTVVEKLFIWRS